MLPCRGQEKNPWREARAGGRRKESPESRMLPGSAGTGLRWPLRRLDVVHLRISDLPSPLRGTGKGDGWWGRCRCCCSRSPPGRFGEGRENRCETRRLLCVCRGARAGSCPCPRPSLPAGLAAAQPSCAASPVFSFCVFFPAGRGPSAEKEEGWGGAGGRQKTSPATQSSSRRAHYPALFLITLLHCEGH